MGGHVLLASILLTSWINTGLHWSVPLNFNPEEFKHCVSVCSVALVGCRMGSNPFVVSHGKRLRMLKYKVGAPKISGHVLDLLVRTDEFVY